MLCYFCTHISQRVFAPTRISLLQFPVLSFSQFLTITDRVDVYLYLLDGEQVSHQGELGKMVERSLSMREVTGIDTQILQSLKAILFFFSHEAMCLNNYDFLILMF